jgi:hypothetical protein
MIDFLSDIAIKDFVTTHTILIGAVWAVLKLIAVLHPGVKSNRIIEMLQTLFKAKVTV